MLRAVPAIIFIAEPILFETRLNFAKSKRGIFTCGTGRGKPEIGGDAMKEKKEKKRQRRAKKKKECKYVRF